jgi:membrane protease YdiL (CAAX protease family)
MNEDRIEPFVPKQEGEPVRRHRHDVKKQIMTIVLLLIAGFAAQQIVAGIIMAGSIFTSGAFAKIVADAIAAGGVIDTQAIADALTKSMSSDVMGIASIVAALASVPLFLVLRGKKLFTNDITEKRDSMSTSLFIRLFIIAMGAQLVFSVLTSLLNSLLAPIGFDSTKLYETSVSMLMSPSGMVYVMLVGPIVEEIIFRGAILKSLVRFGGNFAIVMSSLFFALYHIITVQAIFAFFVGLIMGYIAHRYSVLWSILIHILINSVSTGLETFLPQTLLMIAFAALFVAGVILFILMRGRIRQQQNEGRPLVITLQAAPIINPAINVIGDVGDVGRSDVGGSEIGRSEVGNSDVGGSEVGGSEIDEPSPETANVSPKLFRIAFGTVSLIVYIVCVLIAGIAMMSGAISI